MKIGFIGLGNMGAPMAANLANAGYEVVGFDVTDVTVEGVTSCSDAPSCVSGCDLVITMLPNGSILKKVADEIQQSLKKGAVFLDCSTVDVIQQNQLLHRWQPQILICWMHRYPGAFQERPQAH